MEFGFPTLRMSKRFSETIFKILQCSQGADIFSLHNLVQKKLLEREIELLEMEVDLQKIHVVVMSMNSNKAPRPDGIYFKYTKDCGQ